MTLLLPDVLRPRRPLPAPRRRHVLRYAAPEGRRLARLSPPGRPRRPGSRAGRLRHHHRRSRLGHRTARDRRRPLHPRGAVLFGPGAVLPLTPWDSPHGRLALQRLPAEEAIDRHEMLRERPPAPVRPATLAMNGRMTLTRGDGALTGIVIALEQGGWHAGWPGPHGGAFKTHDDAVAACRPDPALLPDLRAQGAVQTPSA